jgi:5'-methylthioinosine phosphorylase
VSAASAPPVLAVIGGTSVYDLPGLEGAQQREIETPFGKPSAPVVLGHIAGDPVAFLARHGKGHAVAPHRVNYRANIWALHALGARRVLAINTVGGITARMAPGALVMPDQVIDYTHGREATFWHQDGEGSMRHAEFGEPYTASLRDAIRNAARACEVAIVEPATYGATQGPRFESIAEIARMARDGCDLVGMTGMPEAALARELELDYACLAPVANWAAGCDERGAGRRDVPAISLDDVFANLKRATAPVVGIITALLAADRR